MEQRRRAKVRNKTDKTKYINITRIICILLAVTFIVMTCVCFGYLVRFNMLPTFHLTVLAIILAVLALVTTIILLSKKVKRVFKCLTSVVIIIAICIYSYGIKYIGATIDFMDTMTTEIEETEDYYVITLKANNYSSLADLKGKNIHTFMLDEDYTDIKEGILSITKVYFKDDANIQELVASLLKDKTYAILISNSQYNMILDEYTDFETKTTKLYTFTHKIKKVEETTENVTNKNNKNTVTSGAFNIYVSGIDTSGRISNVARSDANIIVTVNTNTHKILLTSIPRDYYVTLPSKGIKDKLTHSGIYGIKETYKAVEDLLDIDINYYVRVNFTTLEKVVNALGGIYVYSDYAFSTQDYTFVKGRNYLNGAKALAFSRERSSFSSGDRQRIKNQQAVIQGIMNKVLTSETILTKYTSLLKSLSTSFQTNISTEEINSIVKGQLNNMTGWSIESASLDGKGALMPTYSYGTQKLYVMVPDETSIANSIEKINDVLEGY